MILPPSFHKGLLISEAKKTTFETLDSPSFASQQADSPRTNESVICFGAKDTLTSLVYSVISLGKRGK